MATIYLNDKTLTGLKDRGVNPSKVCNQLARDYLKNDFEYNKRAAMQKFNVALQEVRKYYTVEINVMNPSD